MEWIVLAILVVGFVGFMGGFDWIVDLAKVWKNK